MHDAKFQLVNFVGAEVVSIDSAAGYRLLFTVLNLQGTKISQNERVAG